jgi:hypothetical protein
MKYRVDKENIPDTSIYSLHHGHSSTPRQGQEGEAAQLRENLMRLGRSFKVIEFVDSLVSKCFLDQIPNIIDNYYSLVRDFNTYEFLSPLVGEGAGNAIANCFR